MVAASTRPSATDGMIRWRTACQSDSDHGMKPPDGSHPSWSEKARIIRMPSQKDGTDWPISLKASAA